jgi:hypothetical protein
LNQIVPWIVNHAQPWYHMGLPPQTLAIILLSIGAFTYAKHPEGVLEFQKSRSLNAVQRGIDRFKGHEDSGPKSTGELAGPEPEPLEPASASGSS